MLGQPQPGPEAIGLPCPGGFAGVLLEKCSGVPSGLAVMTSYMILSFAQR